MADKTPNFPDVLGHITKNERLNINVLQIATALRPRVIRAGRPIEVITLVQNASDVDIDLTVRIKLPQRDKKGNKNRFISKTDQIVIGLNAAEVGYIVLPVSTMPDTAVGADYQIILDVKIEQPSNKKPRRVRQQSGGGAVDLTHLSEETLQEIEDLSALNFTAKKQGGLRASGLEVNFSVMSGKVGTIADLKPDWVSLWTLKDMVDNTSLLQKHKDKLSKQVLPKLTRYAMFEPLRQKTEQRFQAAGYPLKHIEVNLVAKLMTLILEYAAPSQAMYAAAGGYNIQRLLAGKDDGSSITMPKWCTAFLHALNRDERVAQSPERAIPHFAYDELLHDAMLHAFERIEMALSEDIGSAVEREAFIDGVLVALKDNQDLDFEKVYMPLVLGGMTVSDIVTVADENGEMLVNEMRTMLEARQGEKTINTEPIFAMGERLLAKILLKYGYDADRM